MNFLLARRAKLAAHAIFLKSTSFFFNSNMFVKWTMKDKSVIKFSSRLVVLSALSGEGFFFFFFFFFWLHLQECVCDHAHTNIPTNLHKFVTLVLCYLVE